MNDDLTPQEEELYKRLPREHMPEGLEDRVVGAMQNRGFLRKRRGVIEITNTHLSALVAACIALVAGAYALGHWQGGSGAIIPNAATLEQRARPQAKPPASPKEGAPTSPGDQENAPARDQFADALQSQPEQAEKAQPEKKAEAGRGSLDEVMEGEAPAVTNEADRTDVRGGRAKQARDATKRDLGTTEAAGKDKTATGTSATSDKVTADKPAAPEKANRTGEVQSREEGLASGTATPQSQTPLPQSAAPQEKSAIRPLAKGSTDERAAKTSSVYGAAPEPAAMADEAQTEGANRQTLIEPPHGTPGYTKRTFLLKGIVLVVTAPDSVNIKMDPGGRMLVLYTKDGPVYVRLDDK